MTVNPIVTPKVFPRVFNWEQLSRSVNPPTYFSYRWVEQPNCLNQLIPSFLKFRQFSPSKIKNGSAGWNQGRGDGRDEVSRYSADRILE